MADEGIQPNAPRSDAPARLRPGADVDIRRQDSGVSTVIPYTNPRALIAYYCGVFALIPCLGGVLGPVALVLGILGLMQAKANPEAKGTVHAIIGIVLGALTTLFNLAVALGIVAAYLAAKK